MPSAPTGYSGSNPSTKFGSNVGHSEVSHFNYGGNLDEAGELPATSKPIPPDTYTDGANFAESSMASSVPQNAGQYMSGAQMMYSNQQ